MDIHKNGCAMMYPGPIFALKEWRFEVRSKCGTFYTCWPKIIKSVLIMPSVPNLMNGGGLITGSL